MNNEPYLLLFTKCYYLNDKNILQMVGGRKRVSRRKNQLQPIVETEAPRDHHKRGRIALLKMTQRVHEAKV